MPGALFINPVGKRALSKTTRSPARLPAAARRDDAVTVRVVVLYACRRADHYLDQIVRQRSHAHFRCCMRGEAC